jgi:hypothetical protein
VGIIGWSRPGAFAEFCLNAREIQVCCGFSGGRRCSMRNLHRRGVLLLFWTPWNAGSIAGSTYWLRHR